MVKRVLIIHGVESNSKEHWFLEEKERLEKMGYEVTVPDMPNSLHPQKEEWVRVIEDFNPDANSILIGHSLGGTTVLGYLEEAKNKVGKCILMATPIRRLGSEFQMIENFLEGDFSWEKIKESSEKFIIFNQTEDPAVPLQHGKDLANYLNAELVIVEGNNHFDKIDFELLEKYILK
ncbi:MAG TPA: alpha/beta fold hydrolase [Candidatus Humimicrobiaceae bacterium]|nr:alpha/beta fold hydrolase [Candidatus Humimicrobiaceae bacterium]